jgi:hypothetical protein
MTAMAKRDYQSDVHLILDWVGWRLTAESFGGRRGTGYEHQYEGVPAVMAEDFDQKYVGIVAAIIGAVVLSLGLIGLMLYFT